MLLLLLQRRFLDKGEMFTKTAVEQRKGRSGVVPYLSLSSDLAMAGFHKLRCTEGVTHATSRC